MKKLLSLLLALIMVMSLAACAAGNKETPSQSATSDNAKRDISKASIAFSAEPVSMTWWDNEEMAPIYSAYLTSSFLMKIDPDTMEAVPDLAESVETVSDSEYIFHLRQGVKFHHGKEFTADDVVATYNLICQYPGSSPYVSSLVSVRR